jgi:hypothetical protein
MDYKTYNEWQCADRIVKRGETATRYLVSPDGVHRKPLFHVTQTTELPNFRAEGWIEKGADEIPQRKRKKGPPHVKMRYRSGVLAIWVGSRKDLIDHLKGLGFNYVPKMGRWMHKATPEGVQRAENFFKARGFEIVRDDVIDLQLEKDE